MMEKRSRPVLALSLIWMLGRAGHRAAGGGMRKGGEAAHRGDPADDMMPQMASRELNF